MEPNKPVGPTSERAQYFGACRPHDDGQQSKNAATFKWNRRICNISPAVDRFGFFDWHQLDNIADVGYQFTTKKLEEWKAREN
jgi:hypothetical protein